MEKRRPGEIRDAILEVLVNRPYGATVAEIETGVSHLIGEAPSSSIRSYLRLNTPALFARMDRAQYVLNDFLPIQKEFNVTKSKANTKAFCYGKSNLILADCLQWLSDQKPCSVHAVVTDPPYGLFEYSEEQKAKLRSGKGGVWRIPPSFDGSTRSPLPRFTVLTPKDISNLDEFFFAWAARLVRVLVPGANVVVASNPLLSYVVSGALARAGLERRGEIVRLVMTMRGGDRPKSRARTG